MKAKESKSSYGTKQEIKFLEQLKGTNPEAFEKYRRSLPLRKKWENIDPKAVAEFCKKGD